MVALTLKCVIDQITQQTRIVPVVAELGARENLLHGLSHRLAIFLRSRNPSTRMNPSLQYAQAVQNLNTGRSIGIIDTLHLVEVPRAATHLLSRMSAEDRAGVQGWFKSYLDWMNTSEHGMAERAR